MAEYSYVLVPNKLQEFMRHIQGAGIPPKVNRGYLPTAGFKSSNDLKIISVLKAIGFIDNGGVPTEKYKRYRDKGNAPAVLASAIKEAYSDLFEMYPSAYAKDPDALRNYFARKTEAGQRVISAMVSTFQALCSIAKFDIIESVSDEQVLPNTALPDTKIISGLQSITINIQLTLPETTNSTVYDEIFKAMRKYLIGSGE